MENNNNTIIYPHNEKCISYNWRHISIQTEACMPMTLPQCYRNNTDPNGHGVHMPKDRGNQRGFLKILQLNFYHDGSNLVEEKDSLFSK